MEGPRGQSLKLRVISLVLLLILVSGTSSTAFAHGLAAAKPVQPGFVVPTIDITAVNAGVSVTIVSHNFPANDTFQVLMNVIGTRGVGGTVVATINSGAGGSFTQTFNIPAALASQERIAIRLQSPTSGYFSYNWFWNNTGGVPVTGPTPAPFVTPTFTITGVVANSTVSIQTANFPANDTFDVLMNYIGTRGVGGVKVATVNSGAGGVFTQTFNIPAALAGQQQIAIRLQSPTSGYFSYNWFWNSTTGDVPVTGPTATPGPSPTPGPTATPRPPFVTPTFTITGVVRNSTVSIQTANFPANDNFVVTMGAFGTQGIGGVNVGTFNSGSGGALAATFNVPASLANMDRIAIRLQSPTSGYFSYNWFWNNNYP